MKEIIVKNYKIEFNTDDSILMIDDLDDEENSIHIVLHIDIAEDLEQEPEWADIPRDVLLGFEDGTGEDVILTKDNNIVIKRDDDVYMYHYNNNRKRKGKDTDDELYDTMNRLRIKEEDENEDEEE